LKLESYNIAAGFAYGGLVAKVITVGFYEMQICKLHLSKVISDGEATVKLGLFVEICAAVC
jgi:hypothetical protein